MNEKIILAKAHDRPADRQSADAGRKAGRKPLQPIRPPGVVIAAFIELAHKLAGWVPARLEALKRGDSLAVAKHFIWLAYGAPERKVPPGDDSEFKRARGLTAEQLDMGERTVETHIARARNVDGFWAAACRLARKKKADKLAKL
jgi:hypothetical protein